MGASIRNSEDIPEWFRWAVSQKPQELTISVGGARIETHVWGEEGRPGLLLVPGSRAHARWWGYFAPFFASQFRVAALSLSGMGGSDYRSSYSTTQYAEEVMAVAENAGLFESKVGPVIIGLSLSGLALVHCGILHGNRIRGLIFVDSLLRAPPKKTGSGANTPISPSHNIFPTCEDAVSRFRLSPKSETVEDFVLEYLARHSVVKLPNGDGWTWNYDAKLVTNLSWHNEEELLGEVNCPVAILRGESSILVKQNIVREMRKHLPPQTPVLTIPGAGHHVLADQPLALLSCLQGLLSCWPDAAILPNIGEMWSTE